jgi:hypothetical protein
MLLEGVYSGSNGGYARPGAAIYHCESECGEVIRSFGEMEWVRDRTGLELCADCRQLGEARSARRHH